MPLQTPIRVLAFPSILAASMTGVSLGLHAGLPAEPLIAATIVLSALVMLVLQRLIPAAPDWTKWRPDAGVDILHMIMSNGVAATLSKAALYGGLLGASNLLTTTLGSTLWPTRWPLIVQVALGLLVAEFGAYWSHRWSHNWSWLWHFHALHHSSERLYVFSSGRTHPVHVVITFLSITTPLILLGAPMEVLTLVTTFTSVHGMLQHANIDLALGPLNYVFATCDVHRWHHSAVVHESKSNFGNNLMIWDHVFGTFRLPRGRARPVAVGLGSDVRFPTDYLGQLASPVLPRLWATPPASSDDPTPS